MKLTPDQRRQRILALCAQDERIRQMRPYFDRGKTLFIRLTKHLPLKLRDRLWEFPGMGHFLHSRLLTLVCENMKFTDEE